MYNMSVAHLGFPLSTMRRPSAYRIPMFTSAVQLWNSLSMCVRLFPAPEQYNFHPFTDAVSAETELWCGYGTPLCNSLVYSVSSVRGLSFGVVRTGKYRRFRRFRKIQERRFEWGKKKIQERRFEDSGGSKRDLKIEDSKIREGQKEDSRLKIRRFGRVNKKILKKILKIREDTSRK